MTIGRFTSGHGVIVDIEVSWIFVACLSPCPLSSDVDDALFIRGGAYRIHRHHRGDALSMRIHASTSTLPQQASSSRRSPDIAT
ncbi:hypothetical protein K0M31_013482, partial [Melipona bicolor]